jgi:hypothetical protein
LSELIGRRVLISPIASCGFDYWRLMLKELLPLYLIVEGIVMITIHDPDWIIILFFIYFDAFRVEKIRGINL